MIIKIKIVTQIKVIVIENQLLNVLLKFKLRKNYKGFIRD